MRKAAWILTGLTLFFTPLLINPARGAPLPQATIPPSIFLQSPRDGQALRGVEPVSGRIRGEGFQGATLSYTYAGSPQSQSTWFFIADIDPQGDGASQTAFDVTWDTGQISDGNYHLRLVARYEDGAAIFEEVENLRVRNYSPVETSTPPPDSQIGSGNPSSTPAATLLPTPTRTPLPPNPLEVGQADLIRALRISAAVVVVLFIVGIIYRTAASRARK